MHYVNAPDIGLCQCGLYQFHGTTFLANFQSKPRENRRKSAISTARATPKLSKFSITVSNSMAAPEDFRRRLLEETKR
jgi:hypothetical protein